MALLINLRQLDKEDMELEGELPAIQLDLEGVDELIKAKEPLCYELEAQKVEESILVQGNLAITLDCECARCLKPFKYRLELNDWACHLPLEGEEKAVISNDCVDLTPYIREDILLGFPQHPLCEPECGGLPKKAVAKVKKTGGTGQTKEKSSAWAELNKLKF
jgi:uncharacterized metal-binding protein YceD (DUF177 family)